MSYFSLFFLIINLHIICRGLWPFLSLLQIFHYYFLCFSRAYLNLPNISLELFFLYELLFLSLTIDKLSLLLLNKSTIFEILGISMTSASSSTHSFDTFINSSSILSLYTDLFLKAFCKSYLVSAGRTELWIVYRKTLCLSPPPNDQNFSKLRRGA